ncbi:MAG TPA: type II toxin-antitoxin system RelE/ParE family toxin [Candidatus Limnocylindrales bacterium]
MASYRILIKRSAARELEDLPTTDRRRVVTRIQGLATDPRPPGCEKLSGEEKYRIRQGDLRVLYEVADRESIVTVVRIGHRRDVYR